MRDSDSASELCEAGMTFDTVQQHLEQLEFRRSLGYATSCAHRAR